MKKNYLAILSLVAIGTLALSSCDTPTGQGAAAGAGAGAIIGNIAGHGGGRSTVIGAAIGAATGALIGHAIQENRAQTGPPPAGGFPYAKYAGSPGMYHSPYTDRVYDLRAVPHGGLTQDVDTNQYFRRP